MEKEQSDLDDIAEIPLEDGLDLNNHDLFDEEIAAEITETDSPEVMEVENETKMTNHIYGWIAIALSLLSFFIMPYIFAGAAIILGFVARTHDRVILGSASIVIGVISIIARILIL